MVNIKKNDPRSVFFFFMNPPLGHHSFARNLPSDVPALAWPECPSFGLGLGSSGFVKAQARPKAKRGAWPGLACA
jgi:hypothetical protein